MHPVAVPLFKQLLLVNFGLHFLFVEGVHSVGEVEFEMVLRVSEETKSTELLPNRFTSLALGLGLSLSDLNKRPVSLVRV